MQKYQYHLFICMNKRAENDPRGCCLSRGSEEILSTFKVELKKRGLKGKIRANRAGCLDACAFGPSVVIYPEGIWYTVKTKEDALEVIEEHLVKGKTIERLLMKSPWAKG
ncbi:MAG: (2Fe-2S) ferredoxin domain-containing protein [Nitrospira sp.]|nr:(2Fe-2S) ferredoxin domain-containing protein [Candidatus Manganitrophaceae bacterium]HIL33994.1 (2Fe-2S) ferredoxin domain-containing protein [Candidatus Manganitrophaceae bacterium]